MHLPREKKITCQQQENPNLKLERIIKSNAAMLYFYKIKFKEIFEKLFCTERLSVQTIQINNTMCKP